MIIREKNDEVGSLGAQLKGKATRKKKKEQKS